MYKLETLLTHFRFFEGTHTKEIFQVEWYKLFENEDNSESYGVCFTEKELDTFLLFIKDSLNFTTPSHSACDSENTPRCGYNDRKPIQATQPMNILLRRKPLITHRDNTFFPCMDIELLNNSGEINHELELPFDLIGKIIESKKSIEAFDHYE